MLRTRTKCASSWLSSSTNCFRRQQLFQAESDAEGAPVAPVDKDGRRQILHQHEFPATHVTAIRLQQERLGVGPDLLYGAVVEYAPVAAVRRIPGRILALRLGIFRILRGRVAAPRPGKTKH